MTVAASPEELQFEALQFTSLEQLRLQELDLAVSNLQNLLDGANPDEREVGIEKARHAIRIARLAGSQTVDPDSSSESIPAESEVAEQADTPESQWNLYEDMTDIDRRQN